MRRVVFWMRGGLVVACLLAGLPSAHAQKKTVDAELVFPPTLPNGQKVVTDTSDEFLKSRWKLQPGVSVATAAPTVDFLFFPGQDYPGNPWSNWGDSLVVDGKYYASIGDHHSLGEKRSTDRSGNAFVFEYDPQTKSLRQLVDLQKLLNLPAGHYTPGKIHSRIDLGSDGWLYFATYRGGNGTTDEFHYQGDWIIRLHPKTGKAEIVVRGAVPKHGIQTSVLDPQRMIFYGGTRAGSLSPIGKNRGQNDELFFAYDLKSQRLMYSGPKRDCWPWPIFAQSTGRTYFVQGLGDEAALVRYDPKQSAPPVKIAGPTAFEGASTAETPQGFVYTASINKATRTESLWSLNTKTEEIQELGPACIGETPRMVASLDADSTGRYLYYTPGAHGGSELDGTPIVQFDVRTKRRKVIAFLNPLYDEKYGCTLKGTYSSALSADGSTLFVTWNVSRNSKVWDCCALTVIHIPESERQP